jgi:uncharacterized damage-inducible protein DinB
MVADPLVETWDISARVVRYVLDAVDDRAWEIERQKGHREVPRIFAHVHSARVMWLDAAAKDLVKGFGKLSKDDPVDRATLERSLDASAAALGELIGRGIETGRIKGAKPHPTAFVGYCISHEGYHLGEVGILLQQAGLKLPDKIAYGMWEWGVR